MKVLSGPCEGCPFSASSIVSPARVRDIVETCTAQDTHFLCHKFARQEDDELDEDGMLDRPMHPDEAICGGFYKALPGVGQLVRIMGRIGGLEFIEPPPVTGEYTPYRKQNRSRKRKAS